MDDRQIITELGGTTKVALMCEVTPQAVSQWKKKGIPMGWRRFLELKRPKVFAALARREATERAA